MAENIPLQSMGKHMYFPTQLLKYYLKFSRIELQKQKKFGVKKTNKMKRKIIKRIGIGLLAVLLIVFVGAKIKRVSPLAWGHK
jgi:hypothetical protein